LNESEYNAVALTLGKINGKQLARNLSSQFEYIALIINHQVASRDNMTELVAQFNERNLNTKIVSLDGNYLRFEHFTLAADYPAAILENHPIVDHIEPSVSSKTIRFIDEHPYDQGCMTSALFETGDSVKIVYLYQQLLLPDIADILIKQAEITMAQYADMMVDSGHLDLYEYYESMDVVVRDYYEESAKKKTVEKNEARIYQSFGNITTRTSTVASNSTVTWTQT
jgi:hypothetical protein